MNHGYSVLSWPGHYLLLIWIRLYWHLSTFPSLFVCLWHHQGGLEEMGIPSVIVNFQVYPSGVSNNTNLLEVIITFILGSSLDFAFLFISFFSSGLPLCLFLDNSLDEPYFCHESGRSFDWWIEECPGCMFEAISKPDNTNYSENRYQRSSSFIHYSSFSLRDT